MPAKVFKGANVFLSRNLVPPEIFDSLHDALKLNGAEVLLCCDPSRNSPNDYHVISSLDHEKFEDLRSRGCNLLGPQCVIFCAKEQRQLPKQGFTCCLALDGDKILMSGFDAGEKDEIERLVTAMGGFLQMKISMDVKFVIVKSVLAGRYKWAANVLKKPIVTMNWLHQCWKEHRVVPPDPYRVLPFSGLTICVTKICSDERKQVEKVIIENGGKYSAQLTKKCTHLICDTPEGDKYKVARKWGSIYIITRKWFEQSVARRVCLNEESYQVQSSSTFMKVIRKGMISSQDKNSVHAVYGPSSSCTSDFSFQFLSSQDKNSVHAVYGPSSSCTSDFSFQKLELDSEVTNSHSISQSDPVLAKVDSGPPAAQLKNDSTVDGCVANDSETEDNDLYLSDCRILLVGFAASDMRKLVSMVRRGGGSRFMSFSEKLTHIIVGAPSGSEIKEVRNLAALGVIFVVKTEWLEDCNREKKEVPVIGMHIAYDVLLPKDVNFSGRRSLMSTKEKRQGNSFGQPDSIVGYKNSRYDASFEEAKEAGCINNDNSSLRKVENPVKQKGNAHVRMGSGNEMDCKISSNVFAGKMFCFSSSFPADQRAEIIEWVNEGGGEIVESHVEDNVHFVVQCHGAEPSDSISCMSKYVSSHWIRSSLLDGCLLDVNSHILYSPLPCQVPFLGFKSFRFCVSQYDEKERLLLRNLCYTLGVRFVEKLTRKVTHLLCKFTSGGKYEAACKWGIQPVTSEWIFECVKQNKVVAPSPFCPRDATSQDREGACTITQYSTQATGMMLDENASQIPSQSQPLRTLASQSFTRRNEELSNSNGSKQAVNVTSDEQSFQVPSQPRSLKTSDTALCTKKNDELIDPVKNGRIFEAEKIDLQCQSNVISGECWLRPNQINRTESVGTDTTMLPNQPQSFKKQETESLKKKNVQQLNNPGGGTKKARISEAGKRALPCDSNAINGNCLVTSMDDDQRESSGGETTVVPDVASIIDLLEQTSKIHDRKSPASSGDCSRSLFSSDPAVLGHDHGEPQSDVAFPKPWTNRNDQIENPPEDVKTADYYRFTDTQTESQVVSYAQDLSGMQKIIDRVRTQSSLP